MKKVTSHIIILIILLILAAILIQVIPEKKPNQVVETPIEKPSNTAARVMDIKAYVSSAISEISPIKESLGGKFYVLDIEAENGVGVVEYEDGHSAYIADFTYSIDEGTGITITSFVVREE